MGKGISDWILPIAATAAAFVVGPQVLAALGPTGATAGTGAAVGADAAAATAASPGKSAMAAPVNGTWNAGWMSDATLGTLTDASGALIPGQTGFMQFPGKNPWLFPGAQLPGGGMSPIAGPKSMSDFSGPGLANVQSAQHAMTKPFMHWLSNVPNKLKGSLANMDSKDMIGIGEKIASPIMDAEAQRRREANLGIIAQMGGTSPRPMGQTPPSNLARAAFPAGMNQGLAVEATTKTGSAIPFQGQNLWPRSPMSEDQLKMMLMMGINPYGVNV